MKPLGRTKVDKRYLQRRMSSVRVHSNADGSFGIAPHWKEEWMMGKDIDGKDFYPPGLYTRLGAAVELERLINAALKRRASMKGPAR